MEYTIHALAKLSGVSTRTLRYYDGIGLLRPAGKDSGGCRVYGEKEVDRLQQILFYRKMDVRLEKIGRILDSPGYDPEAALRAHLSSLLQQKKQLEALIGNVTKTIRAMKGEETMSDQEKFEGFREKLVKDNEAAYGAEIRAKYGDEAVDASNAKLMGMREETWARGEALRTEYEGLLKAALAAGDPASADAQRACDLHRQWLCLFWKDGTYTPAAHRGIGEMYAADPRFSAYYEKLAPGCAAFFREAINIYAK